MTVFIDEATGAEWHAHEGKPGDCAGCCFHTSRGDCTRDEIALHVVPHCSRHSPIYQPGNNAAKVALVQFKLRS